MDIVTVHSMFVGWGDAVDDVGEKQEDEEGPDEDTVARSRSPMDAEHSIVVREHLRHVSEVWELFICGVYDSLVA